MFGKIVLFLSALALAGAQIPSLGFCPEYVPMANFDMTKVNANPLSFLITVPPPFFFLLDFSSRSVQNRVFLSFSFPLPFSSWAFGTRLRGISN